LIQKNVFEKGKRREKVTTVRSTTKPVPPVPTEGRRQNLSYEQKGAELLLKRNTGKEPTRRGAKENRRKRTSPSCTGERKKEVRSRREGKASALVRHEGKGDSILLFWGKGL